MPLNLHELSKAFRIAHRMSQSDRVDEAARAYFRAIAFQIWRSLNAENVGSYDPDAAMERLVNTDGR